MSMIVARMEKMKSGNLVGIGNHNQRKTKNHSNKESISPLMPDRLSPQWNISAFTSVPE